ncbi:MAG: YjbH domain-containing protein [Rhizomicrobium sp.]
MQIWKRAPHRAGRRLVMAVVALGAALAWAIPAMAQVSNIFLSDDRDTFGEIGLIEMPSARMAADGQLAFSVAGDTAGQRAILSFQTLPWLETEFRYSRVPRLATDHTTLYDRSLGFKVRLFRETRWTPDFALGIRDVIGTGVYGGEYLVATKRIYDFDVTGGMGWGRLAGSATFPNPLAAIFPSFKERPPITGGGGLVDFRQLFHGPNVGLFGGIVWHTPFENLDAIAEYSSDRYAQEKQVRTIAYRIPFNFGVNYRLPDSAKIMVGWFYGSGFGGALSIATDPTTPAYAVRFSPPPPAPAERGPETRRNAIADSFVSRLVRTLDPAAHVSVERSTLVVDMRADGKGRAYCNALARLTQDMTVARVRLTDLDAPGANVSTCKVPRARRDIVSAAPVRSIQVSAPAPGEHLPSIGLTPAAWSTARKAIRRDASAQELKVEVISGAGAELTVYYTNLRYEFEDEAIGRMLRVILNDAPESVEIIHLIPVYAGLPVQDVRIVRSAMERILAQGGTVAESPGAVSLRPAPIDNPDLSEAQSQTYPRFSWSVFPGLETSYFDPRDPLRVRLFGGASGEFDVRPGWGIEGRYELTAFDTFSTATPPDSALPHVRTDIADYMTKGRNGFAYLDGVWRARLSRDVFAEAKTGYLEDMFGGAGGQILWRPEASRFAVGADLYEVWQRDFDRLFGFQNYHVLTGHVSLYYHSPWYGVDLAVHVGRYLAGDHGATFEVSREFSTGVEVGAYATVTNVPSSQFGEGGFDKGIFLRIPLEWALPTNTQVDYYANIASLTRDGGQRLENDDSLYQETRRTSFDEISEQQDRLIAP